MIFYGILFIYTSFYPSVQFYFQSPDCLQQVHKMINQIIVSSTCCCLQYCCKQVSQTAYKLIGRLSFIKLMYTVIYFSFIIFAYFAMYMLREWQFFMRVFADGITCIALTQAFDCVSASVVYRITFSLFLFSLLMLVIILVSSARIAKILNEGLFFTKFSILIILFLVALQLQNTLVVKFANFSQIFSYVFIVWQVIILIDLAYLWGIQWAQKYSNGSGCYGFLLIAFSAINYVAAIGINIYGYVLSSSGKNQDVCQNYPNILSTIFILCMFGVQLLNFNKQNSLLATSALSVSTSYWLLSSIFSSNSCNNSIIISQTGTVIGKSLFLKINIPISCLFVILSSFGSIYGSSNTISGDNFIELQENVDFHKQLKPEEQESLSKEKGLWVRWHLFMMAMSLYICMILTDWGSGDILQGKFELTLNAQISKVFTTSATFVIYVWTLIAPRVLSSRNFQFK